MMTLKRISCQWHNTSITSELNGMSPHLCCSIQSVIRPDKTYKISYLSTDTNLGEDAGDRKEEGNVDLTGKKTNRLRTNGEKGHRKWESERAIQWSISWRRVKVKRGVIAPRLNYRSVPLVLQVRQWFTANGQAVVCVWVCLSVCVVWV